MDSAPSSSPLSSENNIPPAMVSDSLISEALTSSLTFSPSTSSFPESETTQNPQPPDAAEVKGRRSLHVMEIMDEQDMWKQLLSLAIPMGVSLALYPHSHDKTIDTEILTVAVPLSFAVALFCNGILLRKTYTQVSTFILLLGASFLIMSFYALLALCLPAYLKWISVSCCLVSLIPFAMYSWAFFRRDDKINQGP